MVLFVSSLIHSRPPCFRFVPVPLIAYKGGRGRFVGRSCAHAVGSFKFHNFKINGLFLIHEDQIPGRRDSAPPALPRTSQWPRTFLCFAFIRLVVSSSPFSNIIYLYALKREVGVWTRTTVAESFNATKEVAVSSSSQKTGDGFFLLLLAIGICVCGSVALFGE
jgi:hypothetical protein